MSAGRTVGSLETWQPDDKSFNKHILCEGRGELTPNDESICLVHVVSIGRSLLHYVCFHLHFISILISFPALFCIVHVEFCIHLYLISVCIHVNACVNRLFYWVAQKSRPLPNDPKII